jgi:predicted TPR repeat methyltransferase
MEKTATMLHYENPFTCMMYMFEDLQKKHPLISHASTILKKIATKEYKQGCLIDLGCGPVTSIQPFVDMGLTSVIGVDNSEAMLKLAKSAHRPSKYSLHTVQADLQSDIVTVCSGVADVVISFAVLTYLQTLTNVFSEASRLLKPGGHFIFSLETTSSLVTNPVKHIYNPGHVLYIPSRKSVELLIHESGFRIVALESSSELEFVKEHQCKTEIFFVQKQ